MHIRLAVENDKSNYLELVEKLSRFSRGNHAEECIIDDYKLVLNAIKQRAESRFDRVDDNIQIFVVENENIIIGYAVGEIFEESMNSDNGTGRMGLFDELYLDEVAQGHGLGQKLLDNVMEWFQEKDIKRVKLHAYSWNENAIKMYERNGFKEYAVSYEKFL